MSSELRLVTLNGYTGTARREHGHLIVPVIALMEGVLHACNAAMPEFVPRTTLAENPSGWLGKPVMRGHPTQDGRQVAAAPFIDTQGLGTITDARLSGCKLAMDISINPFQAERIGAGRLLARLRQGEQLEVSVGAFVVTDRTPGVFDGQPYGCSWTAMQPDHLAILESTMGACSIEMGCGAHRAAAAPSSWAELFARYAPPDGWAIAMEAHRDRT